MSSLKLQLQLYEQIKKLSDEMLEYAIQICAEELERRRNDGS